MTSITLFQFSECPYCARVRAKLEEMNLDYEIVNVSNSRRDPIRRELLEKSGIGTVPVIKVNDQYLGDSEKIIEYLEDNF